jgi:predicted DNA-binding antitoxin AbrB/MazE fold protein
MIRAVYCNGAIKPLDELPPEWHEGLELEVRELHEAAKSSEFDEWLEGDGPMSDAVRVELDRRLAEFHALGPMEWEPGEEAEVQKFLDQMDEIGRRQMRQLGEQP